MFKITHKAIRTTLLSVFVLGTFSASAIAQAPAVGGSVPAPSGAPATGSSTQDGQGGLAPADEKLTPGVIASQGSFRKVAKIDDVSPSNPSDKPNPILARVSRTGGEQCTATLTNSSKEAGYSVNVDVLGVDERGNTAMKKNIVASIGPEQTITRTMSCRRGLNMQVVLKSGTKR